MKYTVINELNHFEYHDALLKKNTWNNKHLHWEVSAVNATIENSQNNFCKDMCIGNAEIIFEQAHIESIVSDAYQVYDSDNNLVESVKAVTVASEEYNKILSKLNEDYCFIMNMDGYQISENGNYTVCFSIYGSAIHGYCITISFSKSIISWDEFSGDAWYEDPKWISHGDVRPMS